SKPASRKCRSRVKARRTWRSRITMNDAGSHSDSFGSGLRANFLHAAAKCSASHATTSMSRLSRIAAPARRDGSHPHAVKRAVYLPGHKWPPIARRMAQVTIYLPDPVEREVRRAAKRARKSVSAFLAD